MTGALCWTPLRPRGIGLRFRMVCYRVLRAGHLHEILVAMDDSAALGRKQTFKEYRWPSFAASLVCRWIPCKFRSFRRPPAQPIASRMTGFAYLTFLRHCGIGACARTHPPTRGSTGPFQSPITTVKRLAYCANDVVFVSTRETPVSVRRSIFFLLNPPCRWLRWAL